MISCSHAILPVDIPFPPHFRNLISSFVADDRRPAYFCGRLPGEIHTKIPDLSNPRWCYTDTEVRSDFDGLPAVLEPPKITTLAPPGLAFPLAPKFDLKHDTRFLRGCHYTTPHKPETLPLLEARLSRIVAPPQVSPRRLPDDKYEYDDLEGMIQLKPGIPFTYGMPNSDLLLTIACLHTQVSMAEYGSDGLRAISLLDNLHQLTFGCKGNPDNNQPDILPIYHLKGGLIRNSRSGPEMQGFPDGSFNLASTVGDGEGSGCFIPAVQNDTSPARQRISDVLKLLHELYRILYPRSVSKLEFDLLEFDSIDNNCFSAGGIEPGFTSLQMNVSSFGRNFQESIGEQASWHPDESDDYARIRW